MFTSTYPLQAGSVEAFAAVRSFLQSAGYTEAFLLSHFQLPQLHALLYCPASKVEHVAERYKDPAQAVQLAKLFIGGYSLTGHELERLPGPFVAACRELGLLIRNEDRWCCPVLLVPAKGFFLTADRPKSPESNGYEGPDFVMSGVEKTGWDYVSAIPLDPCRTFLDRNAGSGLATLLGSRCATQAWGIAITQRANQCAEFNRRLNGVGNVKFLHGNLFAPVAGLKFDRIVSNPPFHPPMKKDAAFFSGGEDGEAILRQFVTEAPAHLEPGGRVHCLALGTDREGDDFDGRIRRWLGEAANECDVALFVSLMMKPTEYAIQQVLGDNQDSWKLQEWNAFYHQVKVHTVVLGHLIIQKRETERPVFFTRRNFGPHTALPEIEWLLRWETHAREPGFDQKMLAAVPSPGDGWQLQVRHAMEGGQLRPKEYTFLLRHPFAVEMDVPPWMGMLAGSVDGQHTFADLYEPFRAKMNMAPEDYLRACAALVSADVLRVEGFHPPAPPLSSTATHS